MPSEQPASPSRDRPSTGANLTAGQPSILGISRLSRRPYLSASAQALYRRIARDAELESGREFLLVPSARGLTTRFLSQVSGAAGVGADPNPEMADDAYVRGRDVGFSDVHFDTASLHDLPYQDGIFDFAMGELGLGASGDIPEAVRELVRVVKPMGGVALLQLVWTRQLEPERHEALVRMLGVRPMLLVEWKQMLRDAGIVELHVEDLTDAVADRQQPLLGVAGLMDFYSLRDRPAVLFRAWRRYGWPGVRAALKHGNEVRHLITSERVLGLALIRGTRWKDAASGVRLPASESEGAQTGADQDADTDAGRRTPDAEDETTNPEGSN